MKHCPSCKTNYIDDTLQFCLQDGTNLIAAAADTPAFTDAYTEQETVIRSKPPAQVVPLETPNFTAQNWQTDSNAETVSFPSEPKKSNTLTIILLTTLGMLIIFGIGVGAWLYLRNEKHVVVNTNANAPANRPSNTNPANNQNANSTTPTPTPTPKPTLDPKDAKTITEDVKNVVDDWKSALESLDLDAHLGQYADTVDYYKGGKVGIGRVRADKQSAFEAYDSIYINITNMKITPDEAGDKATALFDKEWTFEGEEKNSSGKVQQQLTLGRINGRWRITGEKDLKIYYVEK